MKLNFAETKTLGVTLASRPVVAVCLRAGVREVPEAHTTKALVGRRRESKRASGSFSSNK